MPSLNRPKIKRHIRKLPDTCIGKFDEISRISSENDTSKNIVHSSTPRVHFKTKVHPLMN